MSTNLVRRDKRPTMMTPELKKRSKLSLWAKYRIWGPICNTFGGAVVFAFFCTWEALIEGWVFDLIGAFGMVGGAAQGFVGLMLWIGTEDSSFDPPNWRRRKAYVKLDALRKNRPHRDDDKCRLKELKHKYPRYSLLLEGERGQIVLTVVQHYYKGFWTLIPWRAVTTKHLYGQEWSNDPIQKWKIDNPTVDNVRDMLIEAQIVVEELENKAYRESLDEYQLEVLAITMQPPPASAEAEAQVVIQREIMDEFAHLRGD